MFKWLKDELEAKGLQVWLPTLPYAKQPSLREWVTYVQDNCPFEINEETLVVGHSSGAILALILAQQNDQSVGAVISVSVFYDNSLKWEPNDRLFDVEFDWDKIQANTRQLLFVHSDNDTYVPLDQAQYVADSCKAQLIMISGQGHFNLEQSPDYRAFPELLKIIESRRLS